MNNAAEIRGEGPLPRGVWLAAAGTVVLLLAVASRHGFHRDELYFIVAGRNLDWGFVDQPPLTPAIARLVESIAGTSVFSLRVLPALTTGVVALLAAAMARRFGGGSTAQVFAAFAAGWAGVTLAVGHLLSTATFDFLLWTLATWILVRLLGGADPRWWPALGATVGVGLLNKHLMAALAAAMLVGLLATPARKLLASPWPWVGVAIAALLPVPNLLWQARNGWPQLDMATSLANRSDGPAAFVMEQLALLSIVLVVPAAVGLWWLLRTAELRRWRPLGITFVVLFVLFLATSGKSYYVAPMYPVLLAAGSLWFERLSLRGRRAMGTAAGVGVAAGLFVALPLLPVAGVADFDPTGELRETVGWPELIDQVEVVYGSIPADAAQDVTIFTASYGEAGAIDVLGSEVGLPAAVSGHNTYWMWGPPARHGPIIGVGPVGNVLGLVCRAVEQVGTITNPWGVDNEEFGYPLLLCLAPQRQLADVWDEVRHYN